MFSRTKNKSEKSQGSVLPSSENSSEGKQLTPSIISADLRITGDVSSDGEIQIDGSIEGDLRSDVLLVGQKAVIKGGITANTVNVHGTVHGQIKARKVVLSKGAHVTGDILHEDLTIEAGAYLEGLCKRISIKKDTPVENKISLISKDNDKDRIKNLGISALSPDAPTETAVESDSDKASDLDKDDNGLVQS